MFRSVRSLHFLLTTENYWQPQDARVAMGAVGGQMMLQGKGVWLMVA